MELLDVSDGKWKNLEAGVSFDQGIFLVRGSSREVTVGINELLNKRKGEKGNNIHYFLCSGDSFFSVPCYVSLSDYCDVPCELVHTHALELGGFLSPGEALHSPYQAVDAITALGKKTFNTIIIECLVRPKADNLAFIKLLIRSTLVNNGVLICFFHRDLSPNRNQKLHINAAIVNALYFLYLCGGRARKTDFVEYLNNKGIDFQLLEDYTSIREYQGECLICFNSKRSFAIVKDAFHNLDHHTKQLIAIEVLAALPQNAGYPLLAIASYTRNLQIMLSRFSTYALRSTVASHTNAITSYFGKLRLEAKAAGDTELFLNATINYIAAILWKKKTLALRIYHILSKEKVKNSIPREMLFGCWFAIGQILAKNRDQTLLAYAADCFQRCRKAFRISIQELPTTQATLPTLNNAEALVFMKQGFPQKALALEKEGLELVNASPLGDQLMYEKILFNTHLGDLMLRFNNDLTSAKTYYQTAYTLAISCSSVEALIYIVPKMIRAYTKIEDYKGIIRITEELLSLARQSQKDRLESRSRDELGIRLSLAQAYIKANKLQHAAAQYLHLLICRDDIVPSVIKGIIRNLRHCLPEEKGNFWRWTEEIISDQEVKFALSEAISHPKFWE